MIVSSALMDKLDEIHAAEPATDAPNLLELHVGDVVHLSRSACAPVPPATSPERNQ